MKLITAYLIIVWCQNISF